MLVVFGKFTVLLFTSNKITQIMKSVQHTFALRKFEA